MTIEFAGEIKCLVCGKISRHGLIASTNTLLGIPDLDTRPPEMERSTMHTWVQECPFCGYCAPDISEGGESVEDLINWGGYKSQLKSIVYPRLANAFLCNSIIQEEHENFRNAIMAAVHAAWVCDDASLDESARKCRFRAVSINDRLIERYGKATNSNGENEALMVDLLRRSGEFDRAMDVTLEGLVLKPKEGIRTKLIFQQALIGTKDTKCYTVKDARDYVRGRAE